MQDLIKSLQQTIVKAQQSKLIDKIELSLSNTANSIELLPIHLALSDIHQRLSNHELTDIQLLELDTAILKINRLI